MKYRGFTLIELLVVIVILGILAATAAPKFIGFESESRVKVIEQVAASMQTSANLVEAKAAIQGITDGTVQIENLGENITVKNGRVDAHWNNAWRYILDIGKEIPFTPSGDICTANDLCGVGHQTSAHGLGNLNGSRIVMVWPAGFLLSDLCYAYYLRSDDGSEVTVGTMTEGC